MHRHKDPSNLSLLAQGRGLLDGGVEIECFGDDRTAYSLRGEPFLKASKSPEGQFAKPYRVYQLALPKTYVTRRGQMVLFTSPDDMIVGQSAALHRREGTSQTAASHLKTVPNLVSSSLAYQPEKSAPSEAGQFTTVYLERLREAAQKAKQAENCQAENLEKGDADKEGEDELDAADSGVGPSLRPSSGRLSSLSHFSSTDGTVVNIPHGSMAELEEEGGEDIAMENREPLDPLQELVGELSGYMPHGSKPPPKLKPPTSTKQSKKKKVTISDAVVSRRDKSKSSREGGRGKGKKKKKKKTHRGETAVPTDGGVVLEDGGVGIIQSGQEEEGEGVAEGAMGESTADRNKRMRVASALRRAQVAEERRLEMERKRAEKKALEKQRALEAEERARLEEQLRQLQERAQTNSAVVDLRPRLRLDEAVVCEDKTVGEEEGEGADMMTEVIEEEPRDKRVERGHRVPVVVHGAVRRREGEARIGSSFREEMARRRREEEQRRKKRLEAERAEKARLAHEKGARLREKTNYQRHLELGMHRQSQAISQSYSFSYFQYVPPKTNAGKGGGGKEKGRVGSRAKRKKQPET